MRNSGHIFTSRHGATYIHNLKLIDAFAFGLWIMACGREDSVVASEHHERWRGCIDCTCIFSTYNGSLQDLHFKAGMRTCRTKNVNVKISRCFGEHICIS